MYAMIFHQLKIVALNVGRSVLLSFMRRTARLHVFPLIDDKTSAVKLDISASDASEVLA